MEAKKTSGTIEEMAGGKVAAYRFNGSIHRLHLKDPEWGKFVIVGKLPGLQEFVTRMRNEEPSEETLFKKAPHYGVKIQYYN